MLPWIKKFWQFQTGVLFCLLAATPTAAQIKSPIIPDATLPVNAIVKTQDNSNFTIEGGTRVGNNLFHSFNQFSVPTGGSAFFNNLPAIQNIFTRVTGASVSNIDGILQANSSANLFLLNPNGIIFGQNAQLNIGGSFVATTANAIGFGNLGFFSASNPNNPALLTLQPSALLFNQIAAQPITGGAQKNPGEVDIFGALQVPDGKSLLVVGGNIILNGGSLQAPGGVVNVGGLAAPGTVGLSIDAQNLGLMSLSFPKGVERADVSLTNAATIDVSAGGGGSIDINARNLQMSDGSSLNAGIALSQGESGAQAGDITVNATGILTVDNNSRIDNVVNGFATGNAGNININAPNISITNGGSIEDTTAGTGNAGNIEISAHTISVNNAQILANTYGQGNAGNVNITATDNINFDGLGGVSNNISSGAEGNEGAISIIARNLSVTNGAVINTSTFGLGNAGNINITATDTVLFESKNEFISSAGSLVNSGATGNGGDISINARTLSLNNGAQIFNSTSGTGNAGNMNITASDTVSLFGFSSNGLSTGVYSRVLPGAIGNSKGGEIIINTSVLNLADGAVVTAQTLGAGKGGTIIINAKDLSLAQGGQILTTSSSSGNAGDININTTGRITLAGSDPTFSDRKAKIGVTLPNQGAGSGLFVNTDSNSTGLGGNLTISTGKFSIRDGAQVAASSQGTGNAGNIVNITARSLNLDNGSIITISPSGNGGNIQNIQVQDLQLRNQSQISSTAGTDNSGSGKGGNITLNPETLVLLENSQIAAQAYQGSGGLININTQGIFRSPDSRISASSRLGINGVVDITILGFNVANTLTPRGGNFFNTKKAAVANRCLQGANRKRGNFTVTGTGNLPINPFNDFDLFYAMPLVQPGIVSRQHLPTTNPVTSVESAWKIGDPIVEAQGIVRTPSGRILLRSTPQQARPESADALICHSAQDNPTPDR